MGVPKFYRWISERYPCLSEVVKENQIPEFDNLYLDMNGIIHPCSHPNDEDVHFRITEEQIFEAIFHYIEVLFRIIKPRKVFFMAVDGVAPRAKMNQQRGRRFRSAREAEVREKEAVDKGEVLPSAKRFDSNCITPGTPFMVRLHEQLKYFVHQKLTKDPMWQGLKVYLSGHETPGEGEHKIMDFIRSEKARKDFDPNTRHCLYGLDADLIVLGLITHDPHFSLLREEVRFGKMANQKRPTTPEETTFHLLHLSLMREYLEIEFSAVKAHIDWFDMERVIDDWVLMGYLVGNDFIPNLPDMHISQNALPLLYKSYIEILPSLGGYLNEHGTLNLPRFEKFIIHLSKFDREKFEETFTDLSYFSGKTDIRSWKSEKVEAKKEKEKERRATKANFNQFAVLEELLGSKPAPGMKAGSKVTNAAFDLNQDLCDEEDGDTFEDEFKSHKRAYYSDKFEIENITDEQLSVIAYNYVLGLQWILDYYYNGIQSWGWYFPYHYAPFMSDLRGISQFQFHFDKGQPFLPFQQLLGVLPAASKELLPEPYQKLMTMDNSPIIDYYPLDFDTDLNGKLQEWEAVVLIPFIDEKRLLAAMDGASKYLTAEEKSRNRHGPHLLHDYDEMLNYKYPSSLPGHFPDINACRVRCEELDKDVFHLDPSKLKRGLCTGAKTGVYFPGFPTLHHLKFTSKFSKDEVKIFQQNSRGENAILTIQTDNADLVAGDVAEKLLGKTCFAEWPHLKEVRITAVADDQTRYELVESRGRSPQEAEQLSIKTVDMSDFQTTVWSKELQAIQDRYHKRKGVVIGPTYVLVYACPLMGRRYVSGQNGVVTLEKQWSLTPVTYAYQMTVRDIAVHDATFKQFKTLDEVYTKHSHCFMLGSPNYGCQGNVVDIEDGRVRVRFSLPVEPNLHHLKITQSDHEVRYLPAHILGQRLGLTSLIISRLSGSIFVGRGSRSSSSVGPSSNFNIGLNLKFNKSNQEIQGYSKKDTSGTWLYSWKVLDVFKDYMSKFPEVFRYIGQHPRSDNFFEDDLFNSKPGRMKELQDFIKDLPCAKVSKVAVGLKNLDEPVIKLIEAEVMKVSDLKVKKLKMCVRPHLLYKPCYNLGNLIPDPQAEHELFDRVVNVREGYTVPLGLQGVIVGIQPGESVLDYVYEVVFDEEFPGGLTIRCTGTRGYHLPTTAIINISYGLRKEQGQQQTNKPMAVVKPQNFPQPNAETQSRGWYSDMVGKLGAPHQQRQPHPQSQVPAKPAAAIDYKAALSQDNSSKPQREQKSGGQQPPAMTILTRSGPKPIVRSPAKDPPRGRRSPIARDAPPRRSINEERRHPAATEHKTETEKTTRKDSVNVSASDKALGRDQRSSDETKTATLQEKAIDGEEYEFADMWRNLQKGAGSGTSSPMMIETAPDKENGGSEDFSSPSASGVQTPLSEEDRGQPSVQMQQALSALPKVEAPQPKPTEVVRTLIGEEECEGEEFEVDRMTPRTYVKSGTEELCRMLNISSVSDSPEAAKDITLSHSIIIEASTGKKQYGIPLTVDQLFAGTSPIPASEGVAPPVTQRTTQPMPQGVPHPMPHGVTRPMPQGVTQPMSQGMTQLMPQGVTQPMPQGVTHHPQPQQPGAMPPSSHPGTISVIRAPGPSHPSASPSQPSYPQGAFHQGPLPSNPIPISGSVQRGVAPPATVLKAGSPSVMVLQRPAPMGPIPISQGSSSPGRLLPGSYPAQSVGSPGQPVAHGMVQGVSLVTAGPGHQVMQQSAAFVVQTAGKLVTEQPAHQRQHQQQQQLQHVIAVQQQQQQQIRMHTQQAASDAVLKPASGTQHASQSGVQVTSSFGVAQSGQFQVPQVQRLHHAQQQHGVGPFAHSPPMTASPQRPHPVLLPAGSPSQPQVVRARGPIPLQQHRPPQPQGFPGRAQSASQALLMWSQHNGLRPPMYQFHKNNQTGQLRGVVLLSSGQQFHGKDCPTEPLAVEAAANVAMAQVTSQLPRGPMMQQIRPTTRPTMVPMGPAQGPMIHTSGPNPFVPLQVTKQLNSPARPSADAGLSSPGRPIPMQQMEQPNLAIPSQGFAPSGQVDSAELTGQSGNTGEPVRPGTQRKLDFTNSDPPAATPVTEMGQSELPRDDAGTGTVHSERKVSTGVATVRRRRSSSKAKLAINFGGKNEEG